MKILEIKVSELPESCGECELRNDNYCIIKQCTTNDSWVNRHINKRDEKCPLKIGDE